MKKSILVLTAACIGLFGLVGCNTVPQAATTNLSVAGGDYLTYQSPKATDIQIESVVVDPATGTVTLSGLKVIAQPDENTVSRTAESDAAWATMLQQSNGALIGLTSSLAQSFLGGGSGTSNTPVVTAPAAVVSTPQP